MSRPTLEVPDLIRRHGEAFLQTHSASRQQRRVMRAIEQCRTAALGGHVYECDDCAHQVPVYNSCRNRHCPKCQSVAKAKWLEARQAELLPLPYYHVVFTLPDSVAQLALQNARVIYNLLFRAVSETLLRIAADPKHLGAKLGFFAVLHTWGQTLTLHPHLHCVVPGGELSVDRTRWITCRPRFFLPVRVLSALFRGLFLHYLKEAYEKGELQFAGRLNISLRPLDSIACSRKPARRNGSSTRRGRLVDLNRCSIISAVTRTGLRSPIIACWGSKTAESLSVGRTIVIQARRSSSRTR